MEKKELIEHMLQLRDEGKKIQAILKLFEIIKALSEESEELQDEVENADLSVQFLTTDTDLQFWIEIRNNEIKYGQGHGPEISVTLSGEQEIITGILSQDVDATSAYMSGDLIIDGDLQDAMAFGEIGELARREMEEYVDLD
jgi:putative sterol carrier protein